MLIKCYNIIMLYELIKLCNDWDNFLYEESQKDYFDELNKTLINEYNNHNIFPIKEDLCNAFRLTSYNDVKIVILGQDPYHECGQAEGLAFSVPKGCPIPPSLKNIYKELNSDLGCPIPNHGNLRKWARQGVLLINSCLSVREGMANSHRGIGWECLTDNLIKYISDNANGVIFMLWGRSARKKAKLIDTTTHYIIESPHPSPLSANSGFFGSRPFSKANYYLKNKAIDWCIDIQ